MGRVWARPVGRALLTGLLVLAAGVAVVVWRPESVKVAAPRPDDLVGEEAPDLADEVEEWLQGSELELKYVRDGAVLLFFWHPRDDGHSVPWVPVIVQTAARHEARGLVTVGLCVVDLEDAADLVEPLISQYAVPFRMALDCDADLHLRYLIDKKRTPYCYLLRRREEGWTIAWGGHPEHLTDAAVERVLGGAE